MDYRKQLCRRGLNAQERFFITCLATKEYVIFSAYINLASANKVLHIVRYDLLSVIPFTINIATPSPRGLTGQAPFNDYYLDARHNS